MSPFEKMMSSRYRDVTTYEKTSACGFKTREWKGSIDLGDVHRALQDIDDRLLALEAAQKKPEETLGDLVARHGPKLTLYFGPDWSFKGAGPTQKASAPPTPNKPREPGWYWVKWVASEHGLHETKKYYAQWTPAYWSSDGWGVTDTWQYSPPKIIGPRIQEPEE